MYATANRSPVACRSIGCDAFTFFFSPSISIRGHARLAVVSEQANDMDNAMATGLPHPSGRRPSATPKTRTVHLRSNRSNERRQTRHCLDRLAI